MQDQISYVRLKGKGSVILFGFQTRDKKFQAHNLQPLLYATESMDLSKHTTL